MRACAGGGGDAEGRAAGGRFTDLAVMRVEAAARADGMHARARLAAERSDGVARHSGDDHRSEVDLAAGDRHRVHAPADPLARLDHAHRVAEQLELTRRRQPRRARADDDDAQRAAGSGGGRRRRGDGDGRRRRRAVGGRGRGLRARHALREGGRAARRDHRRVVVDHAPVDQPVVREALVDGRRLLRLLGRRAPHGVEPLRRLAERHEAVRHLRRAREEVVAQRAQPARVAPQRVGDGAARALELGELVRHQPRSDRRLAIGVLLGVRRLRRRERGDEGWIIVHI